MGLARYGDGAWTHEHGLVAGRADRPDHRSVLFSADGKDLCGCGVGERMTDIAIRVEGLGKRYQIGARQERYYTLRDTMTETVTRPFHKLYSFFRKNGTGSRSPDASIVWALKDVSFEVKPGEVVGIIGRNGAGKSTLLKILSRITEPTEGRVRIRGRVGSLLEVGTGFHPELTGRENIYLNGAILGMKKAEIDRKFEEIVAFAEIEKFIDTPVKHYSSGMYVRLAFAVAAHLEPEILIVDEVLAVGDSAFQNKCLGKMGKVAREGRTVVFFSHNMAAIECLCSSCLLFEQGQLKVAGEPRELIGRYLGVEFERDSGEKDLSSHPGRMHNSEPIMKNVALLSRLAQPVSSLSMGASLAIQVTFFCNSKALRPVLGVVIKNVHGMPILGVNNRFIGGYEFSEPVRHGFITCHLETLPLMPGTYFVDLYFGDQHQDYDIIHEAISFNVLATDVFGTGQLPPPAAGPIYWPARWTFQHVNPDCQGPPDPSTVPT